MQTTSRFALESHAGPYEKWPLRSRVIVDGEPSPTVIPGYCLLDQFKIPGGYLLITDYDCPFEEATSFVLLGFSSELLSHRTLGVPYGSFNLEQIDWMDEMTAEVVFWENDRWLLTLRPWGIPFLRPRIHLRRIHETTLKCDVTSGQTKESH